MPERHVTSSPPDTDSLFQLPLAEFTAARNALASRLNKAGKRADGERVKGMAKPSISAWAVNQLYWRHRTTFDRLMASGEQLRKAQASQLSGGSAEMRGPIEARREALAELSRLAAETLAGSGHQPTPDTMRRVTTTLEALSAYGTTPGAPPAGRLLDDIDPPGFEALASLVPAIGPGSRRAGDRSTVLAFHTAASRRPPTSRKNAAQQDAEQDAQRSAERAAAKAAVQAAERHLREARAAAAHAEAALKKAAARVKAAEAERTDAEQRLERAAADVTEAKQAARKVAAEAETAAEVVADAERALAEAERRA